MHDQPQIATYAHRPEVRVFRLLQAMELMPGILWMELQVKRSRLHLFLFFCGQPSQAAGKCVRDQELHYGTLRTFITSSPR
jgi:hypothetical protein